MIALHIEIILIVTGVITAGMILQFFAPRAMIRRNFGEELSGDAAVLMARHWGVLVFCFGLLLVWAAKHPEVRTPVMLAALFEKVVLIGCILGGPLRRLPMPRVIVVADAAMSALYVAYLLGF